MARSARSGCTSTRTSPSSATWPGRGATTAAEAPLPGAEGARLEIDLEAVAENYAALKAAAAGAEIAPVLKADAYGAGAGPVAARLLREGARRFFVARISEGEALRRSLGARPAEILVFDGCPPGAMGRLLNADLTPVLNSREELALWGGAGRACALHVDTGMNRLGLRPEEAHALAEARDRPRVRLLLSHLACAGVRDHPLNARQLALFRAAAAGFPEAERSLCNTEALALGPAFRFDLARPGVGLHGFGPAPLAARLRTAARLTAPVLQVRTVPPGESVGYGAGFRAERPLRVAIVAAGYADGVLRASGSGGYGWHDGRARPILGLVSMDLLALDVSDGSEPRVGDRVELLGPNVPLAAAAAAAGATPYEVLAQAARRVRPAQAL